MSSEQSIFFDRAQPSDAKEIENLYRQLTDNKDINVTAAAIQSIATDKSNFLLVGRERKRIVATALFTICRDVMFNDQPFAVVENIVVDIEKRGLGYGKSLMGYLKCLGREHRCTKIMLLSSTSRSEAHSFFEKCGYRSDVKKGFVNYINR
jgi:N-acetylglutamate synthase-like GNAT family acetyltransferase